MDIRPTTPDDADAIMAIARFLPQWFTKTGLEHLATDLKFQAGLVAVEGEGVIGFLTYFVYEAIGNIGWMGVEPNSQRHGIGRELVARFEHLMKAAGVGQLQVWTLGDSVDYEPYARTRAFYRAMGFTDYKREKHDNPECPESLHLRKRMQ